MAYHRSTTRRPTRGRLTAAAEFLWDALKTLVLYVAPAGWALLVAVGALVRDGHPLAAGTLIAAVYVLGVGIVMVACRPGRPATSSQLRRRTAGILPAAGIALAVLMQLVATQWPAVFIAVAVIAACAGLFVLAALVGRWVRRRSAVA